MGLWRSSCWRLPPAGGRSRQSGRLWVWRWPSTYIGGYRLLPGIVLGSFLVGVSRNPLPLALSAAALQVVQPLVDVGILRRLTFDPKLERVRDPIVLALIAGPVGALLAAVLANALYYVAGRTPLDRVAYEFVLWWLRDWLGVMVTAPLIFALAYGRAIPWTWRRTVEGIALLATLFAASQLVFGLWGVFANRNVPIAFVFFPIVGWAGLRFGARGAATVTALIAGYAIVVAGWQLGPFAGLPG